MKVDFKSKKLKIAKLAKKHHLCYVVLYGSYAKGQARPNSDIDIAILGKKFIEFQELINLINEFVDIFETDEVDIKSLHHTDALFRYQVTRDGILLYGDQHEYNHFKAYTFRDYMDSEDLFRLRDLLTQKRLNRLLNKNNR